MKVWADEVGQELTKLAILNADMEIHVCFRKKH